jgi:elongation factor P
MRNLRNGKLNEHRWRSGEVIEVLRVEVNELQYLYRKTPSAGVIQRIPIGKFSSGAYGVRISDASSSRIKLLLIH